MKKIQEIANGVVNTIWKDEVVEDEAKRRIFVCLLPDSKEPHCRYYNDKTKLGPKCDACGCILKFKARSKDSKCPLGKWRKDEGE